MMKNCVKKSESYFLTIFRAFNLTNYFESLLFVMEFFEKTNSDDIMRGVNYDLWYIIA